MKRFYIENYGEDSKSILKTFEYVKRRSQGNKIYIVLQKKEFIENLKSTLKNEFSLIKEAEILFLNEVSKGYKFEENSSVISIWISSDDYEGLFYLEDSFLGKISNFAVIPLDTERIDLWLNTYGATNINSDIDVIPLTILNEDLKKELYELNKVRVNWSILNKSDIDILKKVFGKYKNNEEANNISAYLIREKKLQKSVRIEVLKIINKNFR